MILEPRMPLIDSPRHIANQASELADTRYNFNTQPELWTDCYNRAVAELKWADRQDSKSVYSAYQRFEDYMILALVAGAMVLIMWALEGFQ